jgi:hypothetical protein
VSTAFVYGDRHNPEICFPSLQRSLSLASGGGTLSGPFLETGYASELLPAGKARAETRVLYLKRYDRVEASILAIFRLTVPSWTALLNFSWWNGHVENEPNEMLLFFGVTESLNTRLANPRVATVRDEDLSGYVTRRI